MKAGQSQAATLVSSFLNHHSHKLLVVDMAALVSKSGRKLATCTRFPGRSLPSCSWQLADSQRQQMPITRRVLLDATRRDLTKISPPKGRVQNDIAKHFRPREGVLREDGKGGSTAMPCGSRNPRKKWHVHDSRVVFSKLHGAHMHEECWETCAYPQ